jgi:hypothetical protein
MAENNNEQPSRQWSDDHRGVYDDPGHKKTAPGSGTDATAGEGTGATAQPSSAEAAEQEQAAGLFNQEEDDSEQEETSEGTSRRGWRAKLSGRRTAIAGGILGLIMGGFGIGTIVQGPLQFMHFAQVLKPMATSVPTDGKEI